MLTADLEEERVAEVLPVPGPGLHKDTIRLAIKVLYHLLGLANLGKNVDWVNWDEYECRSQRGMCST